MTDANDIRATLAMHMGSETVTRYSPGSDRILMTEGVVHMRELCNAYWLVDLFVSHMGNPRLAREEFLVCRLEVADDNTAVATFTDGRSDRALVEQRVEYTDFPLRPRFDLYLEGDTSQRTLMLPSER